MGPPAGTASSARRHPTEGRRKEAAATTPRPARGKRDAGLRRRHEGRPATVAAAPADSSSGVRGSSSSRRRNQDTGGGEAPTPRTRCNRTCRSTAGNASSSSVADAVKASSSCSPASASTA
ncbi:unnamed protein product, partial [Ectocarpus sp. 12 AP-2014]